MAVPNDRGRRDKPWDKPGDDRCYWVSADDLRYALAVAAARRRTLSRSEARSR
jgi:hypothetical protein